MFTPDPNLPISPSDISLSRSIAPTSSLSQNKNFTTEIAEHAEIKKIKGSNAKVQGEKGAHFERFPKA
jgi:hypothetical protein